MGFFSDYATAVFKGKTADFAADQAKQAREEARRARAAKQAKRAKAKAKNK